MSAAIGAVHVDVVPSTRDFVRDMKNDILRGADEIGAELGQRIGGDAAKAASRRISEGIEDGVDNANTEGKAAKRGQKTGSAFARTLKAEIEKAIYSLPEIDLDADISDVQRALGEVRAELDELRDKKIGIDINARGALEEVTALREELQAIARDQTVDVDVRYDAKTAAESLGNLERQIAKDVGGSFDNTLRRNLQSAIDKLPKIDLRADSSPVEATLRDLRSEIAAFADDVAINLDVNGDEALAKVETFRAALQVLIDDETVDIKVRSDASAALRDLTAITGLKESLSTAPAEIEVEVHTPDLGAFRTKLIAGIKAAQASLPEIEIDANTDLTTRKIAKIRTELAALAQKVELGLADDKALAQLDKLAARLRVLSNQRIGLELDSDISTALEQVRAAVTAAGRRDGDAFGSAFKNALRGALANLPDIRLNANPTQAEQAIATVRTQLNGLLDKTVGVDIDAATAIAKAEALQALLKSISDNATDVQVKFNADQGAAQIEAFIAKIRGEDVTVPVHVEPELGAFRSKLAAAVKSASATLPPIELDANSTLIDRKVVKLKAELATLSEQITLGLADDQALAKLDKITAKLRVLANQNINLELNSDIDAALAQVRAAVTEAGARDGDAFGSAFKNGLRGALANLPNIDLKANPDQAERAIASIKTQIETLTDKTIGIDISSADAVAKVEALQALLTAISENATDLQIKLDTAQAAAQLAAFIATANGTEVNVEVKAPELGAFLTRVKAELEKARLTLPDIELRANTAQVYRDVAAVKATITNISGNINFDTDVPATLAELELVEAEVRRIGATTADIKITADIKQLLASIAAAKLALAGIDGETNNIVAGTQRWRLILAVVLALLPLIGGAMLAITGLVVAFLVPVLAVVAGFQGVKAAAAGLGDEIDRIQKASSAAFQNGLKPAMADIERLLQAVLVPITQTSIALADMASQVAKTAASAQNLQRLTDTMTNIRALIATLTPAFQVFIDNLLKLSSIGTQAMIGFGDELRQVAVDFGAMIDRLTSTGTAQAAITALFQVLSSLIGLIGPITELGSVMLAAVGPALAAALNGIGALFTGLAIALNVFAQAAGPVGPALATIITTMILFRVTMLALGKPIPSLVNVLGRMGTAGTAAGVGLLNVSQRANNALNSLGQMGAVGARAATGLRAVGTAISTAFGGGVGLVITGIVLGLTALGIAQSNAAADAAEHKQAIEELSGALRDSGGAINSNIIDLTNQKLAAANVGDSLNDLGLSANQVSGIIAAGGGSYDALIQKLKDMSDAVVTESNVLDGSADSINTNQEAARTLLPVIESLRGQFVDAAAANKVLTDALFVTGTSLVGGLANSKALEGAIATLGNTSSTTSDKVTALKAALDALNGGTLTAEEAARKLNEVILNLGKGITEAVGGNKKLANSLVDATGKIDTTSAAGQKLFDSVTGIRDAALESATAAFDAAGGLTNLQGASAAASSEIQRSRDALIKAATAAGISKDKAIELADAYGLIPAEVATTLSAKNLPQVNQELLQLSALITNQIPGTKTVTVTALSDAALKALDALGIKVEKLPDGKFSVTIDDKTLPAINGIVNNIEGQHPELPVGANTQPFTSQIDAQIATLTAQKRDLPVGAQLERKDIDTQIAALRAQKNSIGFDGDFNPVLNQLPGLVATINASVPPITIDGNPIPATDALASVLTAISAGKAEVNIGGNPVNATSALSQILNAISTSNASVTINGVDVPARQVLSATLAAIAAGKSSVSIGGIDVPAQAVLAALLGKIGLSKESVTALLNDAAARAALDALTKPRTVTLTVVETKVAAAAATKGDRLNAALGALGHVISFNALGSMSQTKRMNPAMARIVPPNTWRVVGDRARGDEAFIPINNSPRSESLLGITAARMGFGLAPQADGSLLSTLQSTANLAARIRKTRLTTQQAGTFTANGSQPGAGGTFAGQVLGGDTKALEGKLDQIAALLAKAPSGASITVEDKSGNPVETARATQLALRLAR